MTHQKFELTMNRLSIVAGAAAMLALPSVALSAPTGGAVYRAAPVIVRPAFPQKAGEQSRGDFKIPFHVDAAPKTAGQTERFPTFQSRSFHAWTWRPNYVWFSNPCFANGANWAPLQGAAGSQSTMPDVKIGSLAGDPKHSVLGAHASDIANLASSSTDSLDTSSTTGLHFEWQPSICQPSLDI